MARHELVRRLVEGVMTRREEIAGRWLEEIRAHLPESPIRIFPDDTLLDHVPEVLAVVLEAIVEGRSPAEDSLVRDELGTLARMRRSQGYELQELLTEFKLLNQLILSAMEEECARFGEPVEPLEVFRVARSVQEALSTLSVTTSEVYERNEVSDREVRAELLSIFGRAVTHELRNRLNTAVMQLELFREQGMDEQGAQRMRRALQSIEDAAGDVFTVAVTHREAGEAPGRRRALREVVETVIEELNDAASVKHVELRLPHELPDFQVDASRVRLALVNLVGNAIKYRDPSEEPSWVEIRAHRTSEERVWRIDVEDNGIGISEDNQEGIFHSAVRLLDSAEESGEGLGLALAREAVAQLGGRLWVHSEPGVGSIFSFTLEEPARCVEDVEPEIRLLLVEDDAEMASLLSTYLGMRGFQVEQVAAAQEALDAVDSGRFGLLVADVRLQGMGGVELCQRIHERRPALPVVLLSGDPDLRRAAEEAGAVFYAKPVELTRLATQLREMADDRRGHRV